LQQWLDGDGHGPPAALERHLAGCSRCRELHHAARLLGVGLRARSRPVPPADLADRIVARLAVDRRRRYQRRLLFAAAAAAVVILVPLAGYLMYFQPSGSNPDAPEPSAHVKPQKQVQPPTTPAPSLRTKVEEARSALTALTDRLTEKTREKAQQLWQAAPPVEMPPMGTPPQVTQGPPPLEPAVHSLQEAGTGVTTTFETVAGSTRRAVTLFAREIPSFKNSH
jgi:hypothetical protein